MKNVHEIYDEIYSDETTRDFRVLLVIIEPYAELLLKSEFQSYEERYKITRMISDFALAKFSSGEIKVGLFYANKAIILLQTDEKLQFRKYLNEPIYTALVMRRGEIYFKQGKYFIARSEFNKLVSQFPSDLNIKKWYYASMIKVSNLFCWLFVILVALLFFTKYITENNSYLSLVTGFGIVGFIFSEIFLNIFSSKYKACIRTLKNAKSK